MKKTFSILFSSMLIVCCANFAAAQTAAPVKIAVIDSSLFDDEKAGITKYVNAYKQIDAETKPQTTELQTMLNRMQTLEKEAQQMREAYQKNPNGPIGPAQIQPKVDEIERIRRDGVYKQEDLNKLVQKRRQQLLGPIVKDIGDALQQYAKQKGYSVIFDLAKDNTGFLVALGDDKLDVTKDFIAFYNARPATAPATTPR
jgi:Skp family chaperone for outer membrane proteins